MSLINILRGFAIGIANVIPGVSGGTLALMLGIYERLLNAVSNFKLSTLTAVFRGKEAVEEELKNIDAFFLASVALGAGAAIIILARAMTWFFRNYHDPTYGFFFGLVAASVIAMFKRVSKINLSGIAAFALAAVLVAAMTHAMWAENKLKTEEKQPAVSTENIVEMLKTAEIEPIKPHSNAILFVSGILAICAMILPGISGSFLLLLLGVYFDVLQCINRFKVVPLAFFAAGALSGLLAFSKFLKYLLRRFENATMSFLLGLVVGSLYAIWPFKSFITTAGKRLDLENIMPAVLGANEAMTIITFVLGGAIIAVFTIIESKREAQKH